MNQLTDRLQTLDISTLPEDVVQGINEKTDEELTKLLCLGYYAAMTSPTITWQQLKAANEPIIPEYANIVAQGGAGEANVEDILSKYFDVENTTKKGKRADLCIRALNPRTNTVSTILIEVKNYKKTVPTTEIDKFKRDIYSNKDTEGGVIICLYSYFVGTKQNFRFVIENIQGVEYPMMYLSLKDVDSKFHEMLIKLSIEMVSSYINSSYSASKSKDVYARLNMMNDIIGGLSQSRLELSEMKASINKQLDSVSNSLLVFETQFVTALKELKLALCIEESSCAFQSAEE